MKNIILSKKLISVLLVLAIIIISFVPAFAEPLQGSENYEITVTADGGMYDFGNIQLFFKKNFLGKDFKPITFDVSLYAENGVPYIDIEPSMQDFEKDVHIKISKGTMSFYDVITGEILDIKLKNKIIIVDHFSRYIVID